MGTMTIFVIIIFAFIALIELPALIKTKQWRELTVFGILFVIAFTLAVLQSMGVDIPSPVKPITYLFKEVLHISYE